MKKLLFLAAAVTVMASCTNDNVVGDATKGNVYPESTPISFKSTNAATTRADFTGSEAAAKLGNNFVVQGVKGDGATQEIVFNNYNVNFIDGSANTTTSNAAGWEYVAQTVHYWADQAGIGAQSIKYWDYATTQYDYIAYSKGLATAVYTTAAYDKDANVLISAIDASKLAGVDSNSDGTMDDGAYTIKGKADNLAKVYIADMVTAYRDPIATSDYNNEVEFTFRSLSAKVRVALYETVPGYSVKDVVFYTDASTPATDSKAHLFTSGTDVFNEEGTFVVYYPTTGSANVGATDYNKAHVDFLPEATGTATDKNFGALTGSLTAANFAAAELNETAGNLYLGRSSSAATFAGTFADSYYTIVIPNETGAVLNLKVNYTLVSTDGSGEVINVTGASAQVPAVYATWKSGYAYTYIFKISQNTNGLTNPAAGPAGLYPITFDAVVMNNEVDGVQETITTVATPSITTYAKGAIVTTNDEYTTGSNIYVVVENGTALTAATAKLYTVELETGAAQTINEASVANAIANGGATSPYIVTDANGKKMTVTDASGLTIVTEVAAADSPDGNAIPVNGAKFTPSVAGTYVFEYINGTDKYYKIIKVQ